MAFTTTSIVRKHITEFRRSLDVVENLAFRLSGSEPQDLPHQGIIPYSERVKGKALAEPVKEFCQLEDEAVNLGHSELVLDSVVLARDESLTTIYKENTDYNVDYRAGTIHRLDDGQIESGSTATVWYYHYNVFTRDIDYSIDYGNGRLQRELNGVLEDGQYVWVDYEIEGGGISEEMMARAVEEAHAELVGQIDPAYVESPDNLLEVAETYAALDILARMKGLEVLQSQFISSYNKSSMCSDYLQLGNSYRIQADRILQNYRTRLGSLSRPLKIRNQS